MKHRRYVIIWEVIKIAFRRNHANHLHHSHQKYGPWWIGWIEEVPGVNCQESTREELIESLMVTLREALEFNR